ncbi:THAP domain-containing protein 1-like [Nilaparvata lugens]|uniref:THAP domain-containing protein 1-like n=1 Tax=Nilaparvata lugens TaxID=108931 RepID=UPI00193D23C7|nr:THAP domain-containing protein 1-like [Nilaparvata lugens]
MTKFCSAVNCSNRSNRTVNISYHRFPFRNKELLKKWLVKLWRKSFTPTVNSYVCSVHFEADSFLQGYQCKKLKEDALPTIFNFPDHLIKVGIVFQYS